MFAQEKVKELNELELYLLEYVYKHPDLIPYLKIRDLAKNTNVSTSTILRFCKKLGYEGYSDFKFAIKNDLQKDKTALTQTTYQDIIRFIKDANEEYFIQKLRQVGHLMSSSDYITIVGIGNSGIVAQYGKNLFSNANKIVNAFTDGYGEIVAQNALNKVVLLISVSGEIPEMIEYLERFKKAKYTVISICNSENCTLARLSDETLCYHTTPITRSQYLDSSTQIPAFYILERLVEYIH